MPKYIPGGGNPHAKLFILGEAPGQVEEEQGIPFCGPSGALLWEILYELGVTRDQVWTSNVYKYRPPQNNIKRIREVCNPDQEIDNLWKEIQSVNPNCILCLGDTAFRAIRGHGGIRKWRGSILTTRLGNRKIVGTIHPANIVRSSRQEFGGGDYTVYPYIWRSIIKLDIQRAIEESKTETLDLPQRHITVCRDSMQLARFIQQNKHREKMAADVESFNCIPIMIGIGFDRHEALVIPLFNRLGPLNIGGIPASDQVYIWKQVNDLLMGKKIIGQNFKYDQEKLEMLGFSFNKQRPLWSDTLIKVHTINPELPSKKMEMIQSIWTRMPYHKDEGKEFDFKKGGNLDKLFHYNGLDVLSTFETDDEMDVDLREMSELHKTDLWSYYYDYKMNLHKAYMDMEKIGFRVDEQARQYLKMKYQDKHDTIQMRLNAALPEFRVKGKKCHEGHIVNVAAPGQIKALVYGYLKCPERQMRGKLSADEDTLISLSNNAVKDEARRNIIADILEDRRVRKTTGTYVLAKPDYDGRIRCSYRLTGTETGRTSTTILKPPLRPTKSGHAFQTLTKHGEIGSDIRTIYVVDEGFVFVQIDLSQAEPRIVANLSNDIKLQAAFESGKVDIHRRTAALVLGLSSELDLSEAYNELADTLDKDGPERFLGKTCRNGGNYDMGKHELAINIATQTKRNGLNVTVSEWRANKMLESFHRESPNIRNVFHKEIQEALNSSRTLVNPYGKVRTFYGRLGEKETYGEGYAEIPQSTVADHMKTSILILRQEMPDFHKMLMGEAHDSILMRYPINEWEDRARLTKKILERPIDFSGCTLKRGPLRIPADVEVSYTNYKELKKVKL